MLSSKRITQFLIPGAGLIVWLVLLFPIGFAGRATGLIERLFLLGPLVIVPLGLRLCNARNRRGEMLFRIVRAGQPACAALVVISFLSRTGVAAALLTVPWLLLGAMCALIGMIRLFPAGLRHVEELCLNAAFIYLPVGCVWLVISRLGANPLGFSDDIVLLTAVHFQFAGFAALIMLGMIGRFAAGMLYRVTAFGAITGIPFLALGISFSPTLECAAALLLVSSLLSAAGITLFVVLPRIGNRIAQTLLAVSALSLVGAMALAGVYALGRYTGGNWLEIPEMALMHGFANALGFTLCGLVGWNLVGGMRSNDCQCGLGWPGYAH